MFLHLFHPIGTRSLRTLLRQFPHHILSFLHLLIFLSLLQLPLNLFLVVQVGDQSISQLMFLVQIIGFLPGFGVQKVESFDLMLFEQDGEGSLKDIYSFLEVDYVQHVVDCLLHFLSLVGLLPIRGTVEECQNFIDELLDEIGEAEMLKNF